MIEYTRLHVCGLLSVMMLHNFLDLQAEGLAILFKIQRKSHPCLGIQTKFLWKKGRVVDGVGRNCSERCLKWGGGGTAITIDMSHSHKVFDQFFTLFASKRYFCQS